MYYKIKRVSKKSDGLYVCAAANNVSPLTYITCKFEPKEKGMPLRLFLENIASGNYHPLPSCKFAGKNLYAVQMAMEELFQYTPNVSIREDHHLGCDGTFLLCRLMADLALGWLSSDEVRISDSDISLVKQFNQECAELYRKRKEEMDSHDIILIDAALYSDVFEEYDALYQDKGNLFLGKRERYDNHGHYDNSDHSAIYLAHDDPDKAYRLFHFFGNAHWPKGQEKDAVNWTDLAHIPGWKAAKALYENI